MPNNEGATVSMTNSRKCYLAGIEIWLLENDFYLTLHRHDRKCHNNSVTNLIRYNSITFQTKLIDTVDHAGKVFFGYVLRVHLSRSINDGASYS